MEPEGSYRHTHPIFLIGFMGCGKTTLAKALARTGRRQFIDLDRYIETRFHANISEIFAQRGQDAFRELEHRMLQEVSQFEDVVVACGGGTPCHHGNMELMNSCGTTVWLQASTGKLAQRLKAGRRRRPLIANMTDQELAQYIDSELISRTPFYSQAHHTFCADNLDNAEGIGLSVDQFTSQYL